MEDYVRAATLRDEQASILSSLSLEQQTLHSALLELRCGETAARRVSAADLLASIADFRVSGIVARSLHDEDDTVHAAVERALWPIWLRSGNAAVDDEVALGVSLLSTAGRSGAAALAEAFDVFSRVVETAPWHAEALNKLATVQFLMSDWASSLATCRRVLELNPVHYGALSGGAMCAMKLRDELTAEELFSLAQRVNPRLASAGQFAQVLRRRRLAREANESRAGAKEEAADEEGDSS